MLFPLIFAVAVSGLERTLDLHELRSLHYDVSLDDTPTTHQDPDSLLLSSANGQRFLCALPPTDSPAQSQSDSDAEAAKSFSTQDVVDNLDEAFRLDPRCLTKTVGWWSYEFCYGKSIKQYHLEGTEITGDIISLGEFTSNKEWDESAVSALLKSQQYRYHVQNFTGGTLCDLNHEHRQTKVQLFCDEELSSAEAYILDVEESVSCVYLLRIQIGSLCALPLFRSLEKPREAANISCRPLLTKDEYLMYQDAKLAEEEKERNAEKLKMELENRKLAMAEKKKKLEAEEAEMEAEQMDKYYIAELLATHKNLASIIVDTYFQYWGDWDTNSPATNDGYEGELLEAGLEMRGYEWAYTYEYESSLWQWPAEIIDHWLVERFRRRPDAWTTFRRIFRRYFFQHSGFFQIKWPSSMKGKPDEFMRSVLVRALQLIRDDPETYPPQPDAHHFANVFNIIFSSHGLVLKEADNDLYTVEEQKERDLLVEVHGEGRLLEVDRINQQVFESEWKNEELADKVVRRINHPELYKDDLSESFEDVFDELTKEAEAELEASGEIDVGTRLDRKPAFKALADTLNKILTKVEAVERNTQRDDPDIFQESKKSTSKKNPFLPEKEEDVPAGSGRISIKDGKAGKVGGVSVRRLSVGGGKGSMEAQSKEIQNELQKQLADAGIDTKGRKVEIKVVTAGIFQDEAGKSQFHIINGQDSKELSGLLMSLLGGETPELKEEKRYSTLESGYKFNVQKVLKSRATEAPKEN